jgi:hypothetical protein
MGIIDKLFGKKDSVTEKTAETTANKVIKEKKPRKPRAPKPKTAKELATEQNEPWVSVISVELDPSNIGSGAFELDWNDKFVANLVRAGYKGKTDQQIVDQWFQDICRNVVLENFEQEMADPDMRQARSRKLDDGRTEFS